VRPLFHYFGSKQRAAALVWEHLGNPNAYLEPFAGTLAVLLQRPHPPGAEVVCDLDGYIANFHRAIKYDWQDVLAQVSGPVSEVDMVSYNRWLIENRDLLTPKLEADPDFYDTLAAARWWMGASSWFGKGWSWKNARQRPHIDRTLKNLYSASMTDQRVADVSARLANVVILSGDWEQAWQRVVTDAILDRFKSKKGGVGVFLDPPYAGERDKGLYAEDQHLHDEVLAWCRQVPEHVTVVLAGYEDEYKLRWPKVHWTAHNGYAQNNNQRRAGEVLYVKPVGWKPPRRRLVRVNVNGSEPSKP
jgi:site-specific DNA-adenine methylase